MGIMELAALLVIIIGIVHIWLTRRTQRHKSLKIIGQIETDEAIKKTLAMGLYQRFKKKETENIAEDKLEKSDSNLFLCEDPLTFEWFVADIFEKKFGGTAWVSGATGDFGVDFELTKKDAGKFMAQVKCWESDLGYEPIALLHSNMIKNDAEAGYIITTSSFNKNALAYARGLKNIHLIDGVDLVEYWLDGVEQIDKKLISETSNA